MDFTLRAIDLSVAVAVAASATAAFPSSTALWLLRITLVCRHASLLQQHHHHHHDDHDDPGTREDQRRPPKRVKMEKDHHRDASVVPDDTRKDVMEAALLIAREGLTYLPTDVWLWQKYLQLLLCQDMQRRWHERKNASNVASMHRIAAAFEAALKAITRQPHHESGQEQCMHDVNVLRQQYVTWMANEQGIVAARTLYRRFWLDGHLLPNDDTYALLQHCLHLERAYACHRTHIGTEHAVVKALFEKLVDLFGASREGT